MLVVAAVSLMLLLGPVCSHRFLEKILISQLGSFDCPLDESVVPGGGEGRLRYLIPTRNTRNGGKLVCKVKRGAAEKKDTLGVVAGPRVASLS